MRRITLPVLAPRRLVQSRHANQYRYEFARIVHEFEVAERSHADVPVLMRESFNGRECELRVHGDQLFRAVTSPHGRPASLRSLSDADARSLLEGADEGDDQVPFWRDHPSQVARAHWAPEEPFKSAAPAVLHATRFWAVVADGAADAVQRVRADLARCFVVDRTLWKPTPPPGWLVRSGVPRRAERWMPGLTLDDDTAMHFDGDEDAAILRSGARLPRGGRGASYDVAVRPYADIQTIRLCLGLLARCAAPNIAAYGPAIAALYWNGRHILDETDWVSIAPWLSNAAVVLKGHANADLAGFAALLEDRSASRFDFDKVR